jgi:hypothetical protein
MNEPMWQSDQPSSLDVIVVNVPHKQQRYPTCGDWFVLPATHMFPKRLMVVVSKMPDWRYQALVAHHELTEALLCIQHGVDSAAVDEFDMAYEKTREENAYGDYSPFYAPCGCRMTETSEPGDDIHAPYYKEHQVATQFEREMASQLGVNWEEYEAAVLQLFE